MSSPYYGIDIPKPPRGYRLARWGETTDTSVLWLHVAFASKDTSLGIWRPHSPLDAGCYDADLVWNSIFAVPKPRLTLGEANE